MKNQLQIFTLVIVLFYSFVTQADQQSTAANTEGFLVVPKVAWLSVQNAHRVLLTVKLDFRGDTNIERRLISPVPSSLFGVQTNQPEKLRDPSGYWKYFMATNWFCGPLELTDRTGKKLPLLKPEVNSEGAYPDSYSIQFVRTYMAGRRIWESPYALIPNDRDEASMREFRLEDYFKLEKTGDYTLMVWPKIYKRSDTNRDICERIDLPPVTIPIHWTANSTN